MGLVAYGCKIVDEVDVVTEKMIDEKFHIDTCGRDDSSEDNEHRAYEPTPYDILDLIVDSGFITKNDNVVDMGSGKGRVAIYLSNQIGCKVAGVEYDEKIYNQALENLNSATMDNKASFVNVSAEEYDVLPEDTVFFFFNPFSEKILETVLNNIVNSYYENNREIKLIFYYPSLEYVGRLMTNDLLEFVDEIDCSHLYKDSKGRECIMFFSVGD